MNALIALTTVACLLIGFPIWMIWCLKELYGGKRRTRSTIAIGSALQELDRLIARPSVVHKIEFQSEVVAPNDDQGGV
jgi:hypothetical protein